MTTITYRCSPDIMWVKQTGGMLLVNQATGAYWTITGAAALAWSWLTTGYNAAQIVRLLSLTLSLSRHDAETMLVELLAVWQQAGILLDEETLTEDDPLAEGIANG